MGICLDTGHKQSQLALDDINEDRREVSGKLVLCITDKNLCPNMRPDKEGRVGSLLSASPVIAQDSLIPAAAVMFFMGGPGSGKVIHAQNLADLHDGYRHINMALTMREYAKENLFGPSEQISCTVALALLARELQSTPNVRTFLISGYPRHLSDLDLYLEKIGPPTGAILLEWEKKTLIRNIELGKLDGVIMSDSYETTSTYPEGSKISKIMVDAARNEMSEFYGRVLPVCERLDSLGLLFVVSGDRSQEQIFKDVRKAHDRIMSPNAIFPPSMTSLVSYRGFRRMIPFALEKDTSREYNRTGGSSFDRQELKHNLPPCLFLMGGPGSNKASLVQDMIYLYPGWVSLNMGGLLRSILDQWKTNDESPAGLNAEKVDVIKNLLTKGELVPQDLIIEILYYQLQELVDKEGIIIIGFPRDIIQAQKFEEKFGQVPPLILLDCSELELGRNLGRREASDDDNIEAAHRRLSIYRDITLPMLKAFDEKNRLRIIDGDADSDQVVKELKRAIYDETQMLSKRSSSLRYFQSMTPQRIEASPLPIDIGDSL